MSEGLPELEDVEQLFCVRARWESWLQVEAALAQVQATLDMVPQHAADEITAKASLASIDVPALEVDIARTRAPVLSLVHALADVCNGSAGGYVHWGATTQNIILTGLTLRIRNMHGALLLRLAGCLEQMSQLAEQTASTTIAGRTNRQHALPITFGFKVAGWIEELQRMSTRFAECERRLFSLVFGGAIGAMQSFGQHGDQLTQLLGQRLGLTPVGVPTRSMVDHFVEYVLLLAQYGTSCGRIANELYLLMSNEYGEIVEVQVDGVRGSSTLPQKVNPKLAMNVVSEAARLRGYVGPAFEAAQPSHEGDAATNQTLYATLEAACPLAYRLSCDFETLLSRVHAVPERMEQNLARSGAAITAENVMMKLAPAIGRQRAHDVVHAALQSALKLGSDVATVLSNDAEVARALNRTELKDALAPSNYVGLSEKLTARAVSEAKRTVHDLSERAREYLDEELTSSCSPSKTHGTP